MYHDQGLIPFKTISFGYGVNFTAGLPIVRTSPDHGTAYDIAGRNTASEESFRHALYMALGCGEAARCQYAKMTASILNRALAEQQGLAGREGSECFGGLWGVMGKYELGKL